MVRNRHRHLGPYGWSVNAIGPPRAAYKPLTPADLASPPMSTAPRLKLAWTNMHPVEVQAHTLKPAYAPANFISLEILDSTLHPPLPIPLPSYNVRDLGVRTPLSFLEKSNDIYAL